MAKKQRNLGLDALANLSSKFAAGDAARADAGASSNPSIEVQAAADPAVAPAVDATVNVVTPLPDQSSPKQPDQTINRARATGKPNGKLRKALAASTTGAPDVSATPAVAALEQAPKAEISEDRRRIDGFKREVARLKKNGISEGIEEVGRRVEAGESDFTDRVRLNQMLADVSWVFGKFVSLIKDSPGDIEGPLSELRSFEKQLNAIGRTLSGIETRGGVEQIEVRHKDFEVELDAFVDELVGNDSLWKRSDADFETKLAARRELLANFAYDEPGSVEALRSAVKSYSKIGPDVRKIRDMIKYWDFGNKRLKELRAKSKAKSVAPIVVDKQSKVEVAATAQPSKTAEPVETSGDAVVDLENKIANLKSRLEAEYTRLVQSKAFWKEDISEAERERIIGKIDAPDGDVRTHDSEFTSRKQAEKLFRAVRGMRRMSADLDRLLKEQLELEDRLESGGETEDADSKRAAAMLENVRAEALARDVARQTAAASAEPATQEVDTTTKSEAELAAEALLANVAAEAAARDAARLAASTASDPDANTATPSLDVAKLEAQIKLEKVRAEADQTLALVGPELDSAEELLEAGEVSQAIIKLKECRDLIDTVPALLKQLPQPSQKHERERLAKRISDLRRERSALLKRAQKLARANKLVLTAGSAAEPFDLGPPGGPDPDVAPDYVSKIGLEQHLATASTGLDALVANIDSRAFSPAVLKLELTRIGEELFRVFESIEVLTDADAKQGLDVEAHKLIERLNIVGSQLKELEVEVDADTGGKADAGSTEALKYDSFDYKRKSGLESGLVTIDLDLEAIEQQLDRDVSDSSEIRQQLGVVETNLSKILAGIEALPSDDKGKARLQTWAQVRLENLRRVMSHAKLKRDGARPSLDRVGIVAYEPDYGNASDLGFELVNLGADLNDIVKLLREPKFEVSTVQDRLGRAETELSKILAGIDGLPADHKGKIRLDAQARRRLDSLRRVQRFAKLTIDKLSHGRVVSGLDSDFAADGDTDPGTVVRNPLDRARDSGPLVPDTATRADALGGDLDDLSDDITDPGSPKPKANFLNASPSADREADEALQRAAGQNQSTGVFARVRNTVGGALSYIRNGWGRVVDEEMRGELTPEQWGGHEVSKTELVSQPVLGVMAGVSSTVGVAFMVDAPRWFSQTMLAGLDRQEMLASLDELADSKRKLLGLRVERTIPGLENFQAHADQHKVLADVLRSRIEHSRRLTLADKQALLKALELIMSDLELHTAEILQANDDEIKPAVLARLEQVQADAQALFNDRMVSKISRVKVAREAVNLGMAGMSIPAAFLGGATVFAGMHLARGLTYTAGAVLESTGGLPKTKRLEARDTRVETVMALQAGFDEELRKLTRLPKRETSRGTALAKVIRTLGLGGMMAMSGAGLASKDLGAASEGLFTETYEQVKRYAGGAKLEAASDQGGELVKSIPAGSLVRSGEGMSAPLIRIIKNNPEAHGLEADDPNLPSLAKIKALKILQQDGQLKSWLTDKAIDEVHIFPEQVGDDWHIAAAVDGKKMTLEQLAEAGYLKTK